MAMLKRLCPRCNTLYEEVRSVEPIPSSNLANKMEARDLPSPPRAVARSDSEYSYAVAEDSFSSDTSYARENLSWSLDYPSSKSSDRSEESDRTDTQSDSIDIEELSVSFSSCSIPDYVPLSDSSSGSSSCSCFSSDESDFSWSDFTWSDSDEFDSPGEWFRHVQFVHSLQYCVMEEETDDDGEEE